MPDNLPPLYFEAEKRPDMGERGFQRSDGAERLHAAGRRHCGVPPVRGRSRKETWISLLILFALLATVVLMYSKIENQFMFYPQRNLDHMPQAFGLEHMDLFFDSEGRRLHGWYFPPPQNGPVILFCHGNAGNISHRLENVAGLLRMGLGVFIFDYRGYGRSEGKPSEKGVYADGLAAYDRLIHKEGVSPEAIVAFGRSMGGAVALEIAIHRRVRAVILESTFTSLRDMARNMSLFSLIAPLLPAHYDNLGKIEQVRAPVLIFHGTEDEIVPFSMGKDLFARANEPKFFHPVQSAGHNDTFMVGGWAYYQRFTQFAKETR
jgi:uncharacterized protein